MSNTPVAEGFKRATPVVPSNVIYVTTPGKRLSSTYTVQPSS